MRTRSFRWHATLREKISFYALLNSWMTVITTNVMKILLFLSEESLKRFMRKCRWSLYSQIIMAKLLPVIVIETEMVKSASFHLLQIHFAERVRVCVYPLMGSFIHVYLLQVVFILKKKCAKD